MRRRWCGWVGGVAVSAGLLLPGTGAGAQQPKGRILGVFDEVTFSPIVGADVIDLGTGTKAVTTETGTISLAFLGAGTTVLQVRKIGYATRMLPVVVSPTDTVSVTVVLTPMMPTLPAVVTKGRQPGDTVRRLEMAGFYERMHSGQAPASAFVTAEQLAKWRPSLLSDLKNYNGRGICGDIYIDGGYIPTPAMARVDRRAGAIPYKQGLDELVRPEQIAGIEIFTGSEVPAKYNRTRANGNRCAVTLVWLK